jgi:hypothetical protein
MACSTLGRAQGRSLLPEAPAPEGIATPLRGAADLQVTTKSITLSQRSDFGWGSLPRCSQFSSHRGRPKRPHREGRSVCWPRAGVTMFWPGKTEAGTAGMQPLPRDNLAGSSRRGPERGGADLCALQNTHRIGRPLCLENPRPQGGMLLYHAIPSPLTAIEHSQCGSAWPANMAPSPAAANTSVPTGYEHPLQPPLTTLRTSAA